MSIPRQSIQDYMHASEAFLKTEELSDDEMQAVQEMLDRLSEKLLDSGMDGKP